MRWSALRCATALVAVAGAAAAQGARVAADEFVQLEPVLRRALERAAPWTVTIETFGGARRTLTGGEGAVDSSDPGRPQAPRPSPDRKGGLPLTQPGFHQTQGRSTGIVIGSDGWILVSRFALNFDPTTILVTVPGRETLHAERRGEDTSRGIAVLKIDAQDLPVAEFVHPDDVRVGQWAFALGRTFGADEPTVHFGIVSALRRQFGRALQIDAYTSPANYGGPVIDAEGNVLGIAVPLSPAGRDAGVEWYDSGIGFAATIADIPGIVERMKQGEILHRGWLGVSLSMSHLGPGAKLAGTPKEGVAAQANISKGDVILEVDGIPVRNGPHLQMLVSSRMGGAAVSLLVQRQFEQEPASMTLLLADVPYAERAEGADPELPASFPLPEKK
ncbi:MAG: S1C family serine protease [Planctomycetota bacterium]